MLVRRADDAGDASYHRGNGSRRAGDAEDASAIRRMAFHAVSGGHHAARGAAIAIDTDEL